jgi:hypothetical protein
LPLGQTPPGASITDHKKILQAGSVSGRRGGHHVLRVRSQPRSSLSSVSVAGGCPRCGDVHHFDGLALSGNASRVRR